MYYYESMNTRSDISILAYSDPYLEIAMTAVTQMKCACDSCLCIVDISKAIEKDGQYYCSEGCAMGHAEGTSGCGHSGCNCHS